MSADIHKDGQCDTHPTLTLEMTEAMRLRPARPPGTIQMLSAVYCDSFPVR